MQCSHILSTKITCICLCSWYVLNELRANEVLNNWPQESFDLFQTVARHRVSETLNACFLRRTWKAGLGLVFS